MKIELISHSETYRVEHNGKTYIVTEEQYNTNEFADENYNIEVMLEDGSAVDSDEYQDFIEHWNSEE